MFAQFVLVFFCRKDIGKKAARKMSVKLTTADERVLEIPAQSGLVQRDSLKKIFLTIFQVVNENRY